MARLPEGADRTFALSGASTTPKSRLPGNLKGLRTVSGTRGDPPSPERGSTTDTPRRTHYLLSAERGVPLRTFLEIRMIRG